ncbi:TauD/TfdA family dioxygenase [Thalassobaculum fulvum]|uniref:TauD/TfdA family dioxygenase n=1 Tax=Thalassobaculum fulvum TaxID=1633335 RepID=A0A919CSB4_9PROT|nr:TauD/TfdA family dioxygenase [Thalassobaculum fulvum]GHD62734.1 TauD/TfdA family dioxygenase [Thalassobaculum fulvum]
MANGVSDGAVGERPLTPGLGVELLGVDLADLGDGQAAAVRDAFERHGAILVRGQNLGPDDLVRFSRRFGALDEAPLMENGRTAVPGYPEIYVVSNVLGADGKPIGSLGSGEAVWHTDMSYLPAPPRASLLYALEVPPAGGDTWLCSMAAALQALPADLREALDGRMIKHDGTYNSGGYLRAGVRVDDNPATCEGQPHPAICRHPAGGPDVLYLGRRRNAYVVGLPLAESEALLDRAWEYACLPGNTYVHRWRVGDVLMWDNRVTMHRRDPFDASARRVMHRTQIRGDAPPLPAAAA